MNATQTAPRPMMAWEFLNDVSRWTLRVGALVALVGMILLHDPQFALGCLAGAGSTVLVVHQAARTGMRRNDYDLRPTMLMIVGRLVMVAAVLGLAFLAPQLLDLGGTVVGIVLFDITLAIGGSIIALRRGFGEKEGR